MIPTPKHQANPAAQFALLGHVLPRVESAAVSKYLTRITKGNTQAGKAKQL